MWGDTLVPSNNIYKRRVQKIETLVVTQCVYGHLGME